MIEGISLTSLRKKQKQKKHKPKMHLRNWNREKKMLRPLTSYICLWRFVLAICNAWWPHAIFLQFAGNLLTGQFVGVELGVAEKNLNYHPQPCPPTGKKWFNFCFPTCGLFSLTDWFCSSFQWEKKVVLIVLRKSPQKWTAADGVVQFRREKKNAVSHFFTESPFYFR